MHQEELLQVLPGTSGNGVAAAAVVFAAWFVMTFAAVCVFLLLRLMPFAADAVLLRPSSSGILHSSPASHHPAAVHLPPARQRRSSRRKEDADRNYCLIPPF